MVLDIAVSHFLSATREEYAVSRSDHDGAAAYNMY